MSKFPIIAARALTMLALIAVPAAASECSATSGSHRLALVELYTSEGCSSCPPADRWLSTLRADKSLNGRIVPLAFHVDYWNKLGWIDPYSNPAYSERQSAQSRRRGASFVYTPQILLSGRDYQRAIVFDDFKNRVKAINESKPGAIMRLTASSEPAGWAVALEMELARDVSPRTARAFIAAYEHVPAQKVTAGENKGLALAHDYVVRKLAGPFEPDDSGKLVIAERFPAASGPRPGGFGIAAFVQDARSGDVYQAVTASCN